MVDEHQATRSTRLWQAVAALVVAASALYVITLVIGLVLVGRHGGGPVQGWDNRVEAWDTHHRLGLVGAAKVVAYLGDAPKLGVLVAVVTVLLLLVSRSVKSLIPLVAFLGGELLVFLVRAVVNRPRPPTADYPAPGAVPGVHETSFSFPSGHSVAVTAVLVALLGSVALTHRWIWPWVVALVASLFVIDTRLVLGVHWFSDAVFGLLIGAAWGTTVAIVFDGLTWEDLRAWRPTRHRAATDRPEGTEGTPRSPSGSGLPGAESAAARGQGPS